MEVSVLNIKGEDTGKKVVLNDAIFGIEALLANSSVRRVVAVLAVATSSLLFSVEVVACSALVLVTTGSN